MSGLSCSCPDWDGEGWFYTYVDDFVTLKTKRSRRCKSCNATIKVGDECVEFDRYRSPNCDVEENIYGEGGEVPLASHYHCSTCGEQFFNLTALGFCVDIQDNMMNLLDEYRRTYGDKKESAQ